MNAIKVNKLITIMTITVMIMAIIMVTHLSGNAVQAIQCWQCNSYNDKFCEDVPSDVSNLHDCYKKMYRECVDENNKLNYTFCRKQVQTIDEETRVIRSCGFIRSSQDCYTTKNHPASTVVCQCDGDGCNHAFSTNQHYYSTFISIMLPLLLVFIFKYFHI